MRQAVYPMEQDQLWEARSSTSDRDMAQILKNPLVDYSVHYLYLAVDRILKEMVTVQIFVPSSNKNPFCIILLLYTTTDCFQL
jgi:hypothetical protein